MARLRDSARHNGQRERGSLRGRHYRLASQTGVGKCLRHGGHSRSRALSRRGARSHPSRGRKGVEALRLDDPVRAGYTVPTRVCGLLPGGPGRQGARELPDTLAGGRGARLAHPCDGSSPDLRGHRCPVRSLQQTGRRRLPSEHCIREGTPVEQGTHRGARHGQREGAGAVVHSAPERLRALVPGREPEKQPGAVRLRLVRPGQVGAVDTLRRTQSLPVFHFAPLSRSVSSGNRYRGSLRDCCLSGGALHRSRGPTYAHTRYGRHIRRREIWREDLQ